MTRKRLIPSVRLEFDETKLNNYFYNLTIDESEEITLEEIKQIIDVAAIHSEYTKSPWTKTSLKDNFYSIVTKIMNCIEGRFYYGASIQKGKFDPVILDTNLKKLIMIVFYCDSNNILLNTWSTVKSTLTDDDILSPSNYLKAKMLMKSYYNNFFNLKLILDEQKILNKINELNDVKTNKNKKN